MQFLAFNNNKPGRKMCSDESHAFALLQFLQALQTTVPGRKKAKLHFVDLKTKPEEIHSYMDELQIQLKDGDSIFECINNIHAYIISTFKKFAPICRKSINASSKPCPVSETPYNI